jgi:hypothetical protein
MTMTPTIPTPPLLVFISISRYSDKSGLLIRQGAPFIDIVADPLAAAALELAGCVSGLGHLHARGRAKGPEPATGVSRRRLRHENPTCGKPLRRPARCAYATLLSRFASQSVD